MKKKKSFCPSSASSSKASSNQFSWSSSHLLNKYYIGSVSILACGLVSGTTPSLLGNELKFHTLSRRQHAHIRLHERKNRCLPHGPTYYYKHPWKNTSLLFFFYDSENLISRLSKCVKTHVLGGQREV